MFLMCVDELLLAGGARMSALGIYALDIMVLMVAFR